MRLFDLPNGFQWIDEMTADSTTIIAWDEGGQRKVWMTHVPVGTPINEAIRLTQQRTNETSEFDVIAGNGRTWLVRGVPDETLRIDIADEIAVEDEPAADALLEYPEEWVTGRRASRDRTPMSSTTKRRLAWIAANGVAFSLAFGWDPEWSHSLTRASYFLVGGGAWALAFGIGQWGALRDRLRRPGSWFGVAAFGQALTWFLLYFWTFPFLSLFAAMSVTAFLHLKFSPEVINNPRRWMWAYPLSWMLIYFVMWSFMGALGGMSFSLGAVLGVLVGIVSMAGMRFRDKGEA